jgi:hypothetical protein
MKINSINKSTDQSYYSNLVMTDKDVFSPTSINDVEMNNLQLNCEDTDNPENKVFYVKKTFNPSYSIDTKDFKMKHCGKVRSIVYKGQKYNSIYHPRDDSHAFYIIRNQNGIFQTRDFQPSQNNKGRQMLHEEIEEFTKKLNAVTCIDELAVQIRKAYTITIIMFILIGLNILLLSYNVLFILLFLVSMLFVTTQEKDSSIDGEKMLNFILSAFAIIQIIVFYKVFMIYRGKQKIIYFIHMLNKKLELEKEIEYWNQTLFGRYNMKAFLAETFDYIGVFYDKDMVYEIDDHFN